MSMAFATANTAPKTHRGWAFALSFIAIANFGCSQSNQDTKEAHLKRANEYFLADEYQTAEKEYGDVLRFAAEDPMALRQLGIIYYDQGKILQAHQLLKKSAELEPDNFDVQLKLGQTLLVIRDYQQARAAALLALEKQPGRELPLMLLADSAVASGE